MLTIQLFRNFLFPMKPLIKQVVNYNMSCERRRWRDRTAVVTGAGTGIGREIVKKLVNAKIMTIGLGRRKKRLDDVRKELPTKRQAYFQPIKCDITNREEVDSVFDCICDNYGGVDILINNAGILFLGQMVDLSAEKMRKVLDTNIMGIVNCTQRAYQSMKARKFDGHIFNICSVVGHNVPNFPPDIVQPLNIYPASKFAVKAISETLRQELRGLNTNIKVTNISPGETKTEILPKRKRSCKGLNPEDIAAGVVYALFSPPHCNIYQITIKPVGEHF